MRHLLLAALALLPAAAGAQTLPYDLSDPSTQENLEYLSGQVRKAAADAATANAAAAVANASTTTVKVAQCWFISSQAVAGVKAASFTYTQATAAEATMPVHYRLVYITSHTGTTGSYRLAWEDPMVAEVNTALRTNDSAAGVSAILSAGDSAMPIDHDDVLAGGVQGEVEWGNVYGSSSTIWIGRIRRNWTRIAGGAERLITEGGGKYLGAAGTTSIFYRNNTAGTFSGIFTLYQCPDY